MSPARPSAIHCSKYGADSTGPSSAKPTRSKPSPYACASSRCCSAGGSVSSGVGDGDGAIMRPNSEWGLVTWNGLLQFNDPWLVIIAALSGARKRQGGKCEQGGRAEAGPTDESSSRT